MNNQRLFQPALSVGYHQDWSVLIRTFSLDGKQHYGEPIRMGYDKLPLMLFQLVDRGYQIIPKGGTHGWSTFEAYSPEFVAKSAAERQAHGE